MKNRIDGNEESLKCAEETENNLIAENEKLKNEIEGLKGNLGNKEKELRELEELRMKLLASQ